MQKRGVLRIAFALILIAFMLNTVSALEVESEITKITNYAQEYETGNINYAQLVVYLSGAREKINGIIGVVDKENGGIISEEQLRGILGEPTEKTGWVWNEKEMKEVRVENDAPAWRKIIFDGNKIQIWFNSWPSIIDKNGNGRIVYRLDMRIEFKAEGVQFDASSEIDAVKVLAENYNSNPSNENANELAKKSVEVEKKFQELLKRGKEKCESFMNRIFGSENKRTEQKTIVDEVDFYKGDNYDVIMKLEMCDNCEYHWTNLDFWIESRGNFKMPKESGMDKSGIDMMSDEQFESEIRRVFNEIKSAFERGDINSAYLLKGKLRQYNDAWNQKSNNAWKEVDKQFQEKNNFNRDDSNNPERKDPYYWVKQQQEKTKMVQEIMEKDYNLRKQFYFDLISGYPKKEYLFSQTEYQKRLVEIFGEFKQEQCNNNVDDNNDGSTDCADEQCNGRVCGEGEVEIIVRNEMKKETQKLYCIMKECKVREEMKNIDEAVCGNHICEGNETESCEEDCTQCKTYDAINCMGKVIFKGMDENNCPLEPICIAESSTCSVNEDCLQPLCGKAECVSGRCEVNSLDECREAECNEGQEKVVKCSDGSEVISEACFDGIWKNTGAGCSGETGESTPVMEEIITEDRGVGTQCTVKEDCGGEDDVCSNGNCVAIPKAEKVEMKEQNEQIEQVQKQEPDQQSEQTSQEIQQQQEQTPSNDVPVSEIQQEVSTPEPTITGNVIRIFSNIGTGITGFVITAFDVEGGESGGESAPASEPSFESIPETSNEPAQQPEQTEQTEPEEQPIANENPSQEGQQPSEEQPQPRPQEGQQPQYEERKDDEQRRNEERQRNDEERRKEDDKRRNEECSNMCNDNCERNIIVPCVQKCVFDSKCGASCDNEMESCKGKCKQEKDTGSCETECKNSCIKGEQFEMQQSEEMNKFEKAVFTAGGMCRVSAERKEGNVYFDGWGEPFEGIRYLKQEYYDGGNDEWCKNELNNYLKQRAEFEKSMNQEFLTWFFQDYIANSAEDWEDHISGIFELYWKDVELTKEIARTSECSGVILPQFNLINIKYESEYGKVEFWEEMKNAKDSEFGGKGEKEISVVTPYMKAWVFPSKEFIEYEMNKAMKNHEFPGGGDEKTERKNQEGITQEEKDKIKQNKGIMSTIKAMADKYGGNADIAVQFVDYNANKIVFNLYVQLNENDVVNIQPMLPEEMPRESIKIEIDFDEMYNLIYESEKEMQGERIESPPWGQRFSPVTKVNEIKDGIQMYFKIKSIINSATITPADSEKDVKKLLNQFMTMMFKEGMSGNKGQQEQKEQGQEQQGQDNGQDKEGSGQEDKGITGNVVYVKF